MLLGFSLIHYVRESKREIKKIKKYTSKPREMEKKTTKNREVDRNQLKNRSHTERKTKRAIKWRGGRPCRRCDPREGVPVPSLMLSLYKVRAFYLYSTVMFGISFEGEPEPLFSLAAV